MADCARAAPGQQPADNTLTRTYKYSPGVLDHLPASIRGCSEYHGWCLPCGSSTSPSPVSAILPSGVLVAVEDSLVVFV